jgi:predicted phosphodiesterase
MVYGILTDIHANVDMLERVLRRLQKEGATELVCLGDVVEAFFARASANAACLERMRDFKGALLMGNHDSVALKDGRLPPELLAVLARAMLTYGSDDLTVFAAHALYTQPTEFWDAYSLEDYANELAQVCCFHPTVRLLALGHEHTPLLLQRQTQGWRSVVTPLLPGHFVGAQRFTLAPGCAYLAIAGPAFKGYGLVYRPEKKELLFFRESQT